MRVLQFIKGLGVGGAEQLLVNSIPHLDRERFSYEIAYLLPWKDDLVVPFARAGIPVHCLRGSQWPRPRTVSRLTRLLSNREIDLVDAHLPHSGVIARFATRQCRPRPSLIYTEHSLTVQQSLTRLRYTTFLANIATYHLCDVIVAVSNDTAQDVRRANCSSTPVRVIRNGIPLDSFPPRDTIDPTTFRRELGIPDSHQIVGHVAKLTSKKAQHDLLTAARRVLNHREDVSFVLIGQGELRAALEERAASLGIGERVVFAGFVDDLKKAIASFDVFVLSSLHEGLPTVIIEAMAMGVPAVATNVGGTSEIIRDGIDGLLVPPRTPQALAHALLRILDDPNLRSQFGNMATENVRRNFDIGRRVQEMEHLYKMVPSRGSDRFRRSQSESSAAG